MFVRKHLRRRLDSAAASFDDADFVSAATRSALFERLDGITIDAATVVDLGAATGAAQKNLRRHFPSATVIGVDLSAAMLRTAAEKKSWFTRSSLVQADAAALPLADESVDIVFSNLLLPWVDDPATVFAEVARVLRKEGLFAFATLGPDSLRELAIAWGDSDAGEARRVRRFLDMHDLGDGLINAAFRDPVLDVDRLTVSYNTPERLFSDLTANGARNVLRNRRRSLTGREQFTAMLQRLFAANSASHLELSLELVFGHCWGGGSRQDPASWRIRSDAIPVRRPR